MDRTGTVVKFDRGYYEVHFDGVPGALGREMFLTPREAGRAQVGDRVRLTYRSSATYGYWYVSEVLPNA